MAITIHQQPAGNGLLASGFNEFIYVCSSTNSAQANFQYVCDIYLANDDGAITFAGQSYLREKTPADPVYSSGVFNISQKIRSFLSYDNGDAIFGAQKNPNSIVRVICQMGEEYGASSAVTVYPNLTTANTIYAINTSLNPIEWVDKNMSDYRVSSTVGSPVPQAMTNRPSSGIIRSGEDAWLYFNCGDTNAIANYVIQTWKNNGTLQQTYYINNQHKGLSTIGQRSIRIPVGTRNGQAVPLGDILSGQSTIQLDVANVDRYEVYGVNASSGVTTTRQWYKVDAECTDYTVYRLHFLNKLGGFDSFSFIRAHTLDTEITREKFKRNMITRIGGGRYGYNKYDLSDVQYNTKQKDTVKVISDWISEETCTWLEELIASPVVFHDDPTNGRIPVIIQDSKYTRKQWRTDGLFNLEVTFQYGYDKYRQSL